MKRIFWMLAILAAFGWGRAFACSCMVNGTVDEEYNRAANVVVLKARAIEKTETPPPMLVNYGGIRQTTLTVEKVYKGTLKVGQELIFAQGGGADCIWTFTEESIGKEYLFYLGSNPVDNGSSNGDIAATGQFPKAAPKDTWFASTCSRSGSLQRAAADILYLDNSLKAAGRTRLSGQITKRIESAIQEQAATFEYLSDSTVFVTGNGKTIKLKTDKNGIYEIYDLTPGKYTVRPEPIEGFKADHYGQTGDIVVDIKPKTQTEQNFYFEIDSAIRGRFFDTDGKPLKDVCMKLVPAQGTVKRHFFNFDCTNAEGFFELTGIPTGSYYLLFNYDDKITADTPFRAFYYPRSYGLKNASEIQIAPGTKIENLTIISPETNDVITLSGVLLKQDGKPANGNIDADGASVEFVADGDDKATETSPTSRGHVDSQGRFTIRILKGQRGKLFGTISTFPGEYENCPKLEKLIPKKEGVNIVDIKTQMLLVNADADQIGLELTFPFPSCKKAKIE